MLNLVPYPRRTAAFTLIELLTVIAIIGILAAIIIPTVGRVRQSASKATMTSNLRQIGGAVSIFAADNRDRMPGISVAGNDFGGINASYELGGGQPAYTRTTGHGREFLSSPDQLGKYITRSRVTVDGVDQFYCALLESPAFAAVATRSPQGQYPNSIALGNTVRAQDGSTVYPFGHGQNGKFSMKMSQISRAFTPSQKWMAIEIDQTTPNHIVSTGVSWRSLLPARPVHGGAWLALMFDGSVTSMRADDPRINNTVNP